MKNTITKLALLLVLLFSGNLLLAQDSLFLKNKSVIFCKVTKISETEIEYKRFDNIDGPVYAIDLIKVSHIRFSNGTYEWFKGDEMDVNKEQEILGKRMAVKLDLFSMAFDKITVGFEHSFKVGWNVEGYFSVISNQMLDNSIYGSNNSSKRAQGIGFRLGNKFFLGNGDYYVKGTKYAHPLKGRFVRIDLSYNYYTIMGIDKYYYSTYNYAKGNLNVGLFGLGVSYGRQFILGNMFTLQYNVGVNYAGTSIKFIPTEAIVTTPYPNYYENYYYQTYPSLSTILRFSELPLGVSGNIAFGYVIGGKNAKKEDIRK